MFSLQTIVEVKFPGKRTTYYYKYPTRNIYSGDQVVVDFLQAGYSVARVVRVHFPPFHTVNELNAHDWIVCKVQDYNYQKQLKEEQKEREDRRKKEKRDKLITKKGFLTEEHSYLYNRYKETELKIQWVQEKLDALDAS